jgi:8-oxo-dGTP pyrophosphatase MutT (NUDIX family)
MNLVFKSEEDFAAFKAELREKLTNRTKVKAESAGTRPAAVMMIFINKDNAAHVFLTKRTQNVSTHKGQVSFPGGSRDKGDNNILDTALRETYEETGINPDHIDVIGEFDEFISITNFHVSTFIGTIDYPYDYNINPEEIEDYIEVPLLIFRNKEYSEIEYYRDGDKDIANYYYEYNGFSIWGMTARILTEFAEKVLI